MHSVHLLPMPSRCVRIRKIPSISGVILALCYSAIAFSPSPYSRRSARNGLVEELGGKHARSQPRPTSRPQRLRRCVPMDAAKGKTEGASIGRAAFIERAAAVSVAAAAAGLVTGLQPSLAANVLATEFVDFVDSRGLFGCRIPKSFLRAERPKDKRGTVFVAGDYSKAEVLSVQAVKAFDLLTDAGLPTVGDLTKWENVGKPTVVADLLKQRRDSDAAGGTQVESVVLAGATIDGDVLQFTLKSPIKVMRTDLLEKEQGVSELYRNTYAKAIMRGDGSFLIIWAGALNTDWDQEGGAKERLKVSAESFHLEGLIVDGVRLGAI